MINNVHSLPKLSGGLPQIGCPDSVQKCGELMLIMAGLTVSDIYQLFEGQI